MKIGDISLKLDMPASTIRYYEKIGLIEPQRRVSGRRVFDERALFALEFVRLSQAAGFSIAETKSLLETYADDPSPIGVWTSLALKKQSEIRSRMEELEKMDRVLTELLSCRCASLPECVEKSVTKQNELRNARN